MEKNKTPSPLEQAGTKTPSPPERAALRSPSPSERAGVRHPSERAGVRHPSKRAGVSFITADEVLPLRNEVLREGKLTLDECRWPGDETEGSFHLGYFVDNHLACIASFYINAQEPFSGLGYQLRGMATAEAYRGRGIGNQLVNFAIVYLRGQKANYIWCNARKKAAKFYEGLGFETISAEFDIPGIGPHYKMYLKIQ